MTPLKLLKVHLKVKVSSDALEAVDCVFIRTSGSVILFLRVCALTRWYARASAYAGGLGSGTPEYTRRNVECVF